MLENVPLFSGLSTAAIREIEQHGTIKSYRKNTVIINLDDETDTLYVILSGQVKVYISSEDGREAVLNHQGAGEINARQDVFLGKGLSRPARKERPRDIEQPDDRQRPGADLGRHAPVFDEGRKMGLDERDVETTYEEPEEQQDIGPVFEGR